MHMICSVLVSQLPEPVQPAIKEWLKKDTNSELTVTKGREFIRQVKVALTEKGYKHDTGYRDMGRIALMREQEDGGGDGIAESKETERDHINEPPGGDILKVRQHPRKYEPRRNYGGTVKGELKATVPGEGDYPEAAVVVRVHFGSKPIEVMLDTGPQPSVIDKGTVEKLKLVYQLKDSRVYGVGRSPIQVCGTMQVDIDIGSNRVISHQVDILDTGTKTVILGRNFLANFSEVCFDVKGFRVKLDDQWLETRTLLQGGKSPGSRRGSTDRIPKRARSDVRHRPRVISRATESYAGCAEETQDRFRS